MNEPSATKNKNDNDRPSLGNADLAAYVTGLADRATTNRVLRAALSDTTVRESLRTLTDSHEEARRAADDAEPLSPPESSRVESLKARMRAAAVAVARESSAEFVTAPEPAATRETLVARLGRALQTGRALLTLPCLAPATAAAAPEAVSPLLRQTIQTGDGVRIEFQQLPGQPPYRLRAIVDASQMQADASADSDAYAYNVAYLTLEEGEAGTATGVTAPTRHLLIVPLNAQRRGLSDFVIGGAGPRGLPAPHSACRLVSATLAQESNEPGGAGSSS